jgi:hypothetical protein
MAPVLAAIVTLIGTLAVGAVGLWQWQRTQSASEHRDYRASRVEALRILWEALTGLEEDQRLQLMTSGHESQPLQQEQVRRVNLLLMKSAPFLLDDEREWAISIVQYIMEIDTALRVLTEEGKPGADWWLSSQAQPEAANVTAVAAQRLASARRALAQRYAAVVQGEHD